MKIDDPRHGTLAGYVAGCRNPDCCRWAATRYEKQRVHDQLAGKPRTIDNTGSRRRVQALGAVGWTMKVIAQEVGWQVPQALYRALHSNRGVRPFTAARIAEVYDRLSMQQGPSNSARMRASAKGWPPPLAWDDDTIDDPDAQPYTGSDSRADGIVDEVLVQRAMSGQPVRASKQEKAAIVVRWRDAGWSLAELERVQGWNVHRELREAS